MNLRLSLVFIVISIILTACNQLEKNESVESAPQAVEDPTAVPSPTEFASSLALDFVTPTTQPTETSLPLPSAGEWGEPEIMIDRKTSGLLASPLMPLLPTVAPESLANLRIAARNILSGDRNSPRIALTFDTGAGAPIVRLILKQLRDANVTATFFLVGIWAEQNGDLVREIARDGHDLANHSWSHPRFTELSDEQIIAQVMWTEEVVREAAGCTTRPYFRAPFGSLNNHVLQVLGRAGFESIFWSAHGGDWLAGATMETVRDTVLKQTGNGAIIVLHSSVPETAQAVPYIIAGLRTRGFQLVRLSELLSNDPARPARAPCTAK